MRPLLSRELSAAKRDPLAALSALTSVSELPSAASYGGLVGQLSAAVAEALPALLAEPMLRSGALRVAATLLRGALDEGRGDECPKDQASQMETDGEVSVPPILCG